MKDDPQKPVERTSTADMSAIPTYSVSQLFGESRELIIEHAGAQYRLRITAAGKLILTK